MERNNKEIGYSTKVLVFDKMFYDRFNIEKLDDIAKFNKAMNNPSTARIYTAEQYSKMLNDVEPMDKYVLTYIVNIPISINNR